MQVVREHEEIAQLREALRHVAGETYPSGFLRREARGGVDERAQREETGSHVSGSQLMAHAPCSSFWMSA